MRSTSDIQVNEFVYAHLILSHNADYRTILLNRGLICILRALVYVFLLSKYKLVKYKTQRIKPTESSTTGGRRESRCFLSAKGRQSHPAHSKARKERQSDSMLVNVH